MTRLSLRWVILLPLLATITTGLAVFAVFIDQSDRSTRLAEIDRELARADRVEVAPPTPDPAATGVDPPIHLTLSSDGEVTAAQSGEITFSRDALAVLAAAREPTITDAEDHRVLVSPLPHGQVRVTALSLDGYREATTALRRNLLLGGLVIVVVESVVAWLLARRLARPLTTMAATANRIAGGALDTELRHVGGSREVADLSHDIERMVARLRDALTERERSEAVATRARDDMQRFLADVSHEIRTPLAALKGYSDLYQGGMLVEPGALDRAMSRVGSESVRLHSLVNSMLQLTGGAEAPSQVVPDLDVAHVVQAVVEDLRAAHPERHLDLLVDPAVDARVAGDPGRLHQAILNLGANACTHTAARTRIAFRMESTASAVTVSVIDHGPGVDADVADEIFLPLYRTDPSRARNGASGAGLGLAITRQVADQHHGSVGVAPTAGGGATFTLVLPRVQGAD